MSTVAMFVHSTGTSPSMWKPLTEGLPPGVQALLPVNIGYSPEGPAAPAAHEPFRLEDEVAHLRGLIPGGTTRLHLIGHSYGAAVALMLAQRAEAEGLAVASLWLYEPVPFAALRALPEAELPADVLQQLAALYGPESPLVDVDHAGQDTWLKAFIDYWNGPGTWDSVPERVRQGARSVGLKMFHEVKALSTTAPGFDQLRHSAPMTLVHGQHTQPPARHMVERLQRVNPQAHVDVLSGLGHMGVMGAPDAVRQSLAAHLQRVAPA
jgi:pimeloyl-ACP methyl ester carboxylesterase